MSLPNRFTRRDFLKLAALAPAVCLIASKGGKMGAGTATGRPVKNLFLVLDTVSARNMSLYGYARQTTPQIDHFAEQALVYHNHHSGGNFTTPGTASLLTGSYPWSHRAFHMHGVVIDAFAERNIFSTRPPDTYRVAYSHNLLVSSLIQQFRDQVNYYLPARQLALADLEYSDLIFANDYNVAFWSETVILRQGGTKQGSLFLSHLYSLMQRNVKKSLQQAHPQFNETPNLNGVFYEMRNAIEWLADYWPGLAGPALGYFHFLPPHEPYTPPSGFRGMFADGYQAIAKPAHFAGEGYSDEYLNEQRQVYDEYLAYADAELGRLLRRLERSGALEDTRVIITADHGEIFERGIRGHVTPVMYEPLLHVPLVILEPGLRTRQDIRLLTSCVDLLPTLCRLDGVQIPEWSEGQVLPPYADLSPDEMRTIYAVEAKTNPVAVPLKRATVALFWGPYKLIRYLTRKKQPVADELYDLARDPEELDNLASSRPELAEELGAALDEKLRQVNQPYL
jgi:arylsulfatase A-like enzyme